MDVPFIADSICSCSYTLLIYTIFLTSPCSSQVIHQSPLNIKRSLPFTLTGSPLPIISLLSYYKPNINVLKMHHSITRSPVAQEFTITGNP